MVTPVPNQFNLSPVSGLYAPKANSVILLYSLINPAKSKYPFHPLPIFTICLYPISPDQPFSGFKFGFLKITKPPTEVETYRSAIEGNRTP